VTSSGLTPEEHEELLGLMPAAHDGFRAEMREAVESLRALLVDCDPLYVAAVVSHRNVFGGWGEYFEPTHEGSEAKVELLCGLLATQNGEPAEEQPTAGRLQAIFDELDHIVELGLLFNLTMPSGDDLKVAEIRFESVIRWMTVRGSSFAEHGQGLARRLYEPSSDWLIETFGFSAADVFAVGEAVTALMTARVNLMTADARKAADAAFATAIASREGKLAATRDALVALIGVYDARIRVAMTFQPEDLSQPSGSLDPARVEAVLKELSVSVGSLDPSLYTGLFDDYPLRSSPFLESRGEYMLAIPGAIDRDGPTLLEERLLRGRPAFSRQRARLLDELAVSYLTELLPGARSWTNLFYADAELDGLVLFDSLAIVVEGKGGGISVQGQRGDSRRLRRDLEESVEEAWRQGARAREYITGNQEAVFRDEHGSEVVRIAAGSVSEVIVLNPTMHEMAGHAAQLGRLRALGLFPAGEYPWSVYINDLRVIAETCDNAAVFVHYLTWRSRLPLGDGVVVSDEIDLWASYLMCERFWPLHNGDPVMVANSSTDFDAYYDGLAGRGPAAERPRKLSRSPVREFVERMAVERPSGWRAAAGACLDLSIPELGAVSLKAAALAARAAKGETVWLDFGRLALVGVPPGIDPTAVVREADLTPADPTIVVACRAPSTSRSEVAWAGYRKPVTFELSDFERSVLGHQGR
jgi:hypothetical protein